MLALVVKKGSPNVAQYSGVNALSVQQHDLPGVPKDTLVLLGSYTAEPTYIAPDDWDRALLIKDEATNVVESGT